MPSIMRECARMFRGYDAIKALAKVHGVRVADLLVLAEKNDPFMPVVPHNGPRPNGLPSCGHALAIRPGCICGASTTAW